MMSQIFWSPSIANGHSREEGTPMSDMRRREFIVLLGGAAAAWPLAVRAQQSSDGGPLIGILSPLSAGTATRNIEGFRAGLRELGYFEGRNVTLALRFAEGMPERMPALATELVGLKPDVIVAAPETSLLAVRSVTRTIPILTIWLQDPVASGAVESIARPGGHVTGTWIAGDDALVGKRLELIKEAVPTIARIGVLVSPTEVQDSVIMRPLSAPAHALGLTVTIITVRDAAGIGAAFAAAARDNVQALIATLARALLREDSGFHAYQVLDAGVRQFSEWGNTDEGRHILIAVARYLAAHSPTERAELQTADIARRLMRGGELHQDTTA